jgi:hypothetical protein
VQGGGWGWGRILVEVGEVRYTRLEARQCNPEVQGRQTVVSYGCAWFRIVHPCACKGGMIVKLAGGWAALRGADSCSWNAWSSGHALQLQR